MAIPFGYFSSDVDLGGTFRLVPEQMSAQYENGFLTVSMPKADARDTGGGE